MVLESWLVRWQVLPDLRRAYTSLRTRVSVPTLRERLAVSLIFLLVVSNVTAAGILQAEVSELEGEVERLSEENSVYEHDLAIGNATPSPVGEYGEHHSATVPMVVYLPSAREGAVTTLSVTNTPGNGTYLNVDDLVYLESSQSSVPPVREYVTSEPSYSLPHGSLFVTIERGDTWSKISGNSFQLPLALALIATNSDVSVDDSVIATGALTRDGDVQGVGNVEEKAIAARDAGYSVFLVPPGQRVAVDGIEVVEVDTVSDAVEIALVE